jgi:2-polyprenyl-3-methyl-5-hydroxy-6-metoxy-1,4-benzoquinol methylase
MVEATQCLACGGSNLRRALDLGNQTLANSLPDLPDVHLDRYELALNYCPSCGHGQLSCFVPPDLLFHDYIYSSGTSETLKKYFEWFSHECLSLIKPGDRVLEIGCNDGSLLRELEKVGFSAIGVDPAENQVSIATAQGLKAIGGFWPNQIAIEQGPYSLVVAQNVIAHTPSPANFLQAVAKVLTEDGICILQTSQVNMLHFGEFDTIYHEHHSFFTKNSFSALAKNAGLNLVFLGMSSVHGGSAIVALAKDTKAKVRLTDVFSSRPFGMGRADISSEFLVGESRDFAPIYERFGVMSREKISQISNFAKLKNDQNWAICFIGLSAKIMVAMQAASVVPDFLFDEAQLKIGRYLPNSNVQIRPLTSIGEMSERSVFVLTAWNFRDELVSKIEKLVPYDQPEFAVFFPSFEEF